MTRAAAIEGQWRADAAAAQSVRYARPLVKKPRKFFPENVGQATFCWLMGAFNVALWAFLVHSVMTRHL